MRHEAKEMMMDREQLVAKLTKHLDEIRSRYHVKYLGIFGSVARNENHDGSDVDVLVDFQGKADFDGYMGLKFHLEELLGMPVDLVTKKGLREEFRPYVDEDLIRVA